MPDNPFPPTQTSEHTLPPGMPSDPRISFNPSRLSFGEVEWGGSGPRVASMPPGMNGESTVTDEVTHGYELRRIIGKGGFGEVWEGVQHSLRRVIAIKRVRDDIYEKAREHSRSSSYCEMGFRHEALTTGSLDHPNIVPVYDFGEDENGRPILAMKLVRGKPWDVIMWDDYNDPTTEFLNKHLHIFISVAQAVAFAHSRGVVHRDIKPSQVMVGEYGEVVLMDWGLALVYDRQLTRVHETPLNSGVIPTCDSAPNPAGTIAFMAPEQTQSTSVSIGPHTDVYLLGGTLYFLLTRTPPHAAPDSKAAFIEARMGEVDPPHERSLEREIPEDLASLCMRALEPDIDRRIQTATELIDGVRAYLTGAGKRRESENLVEEGRVILHAKQCNYRDLARGLSAIERAAGLWPDNPEVDDLREMFHTRFSRLAIQNRDLVLASAQVERISTTETRRALRAEIRKRRLYLASLRWTVRVFMAGILVLLLIVSFMARGLTRRADEAQRLRVTAEAGERAAIDSRRNAEELVNFLVEDLYQSLERLGRLDLIDRVANEANQYYANLPPKGSSDARSENLRRARALRVLGDVQVQDRTRILDDSMAAYRESLRLSEELAAQYPDDIGVMSSLAASRFRVGSVLIWSGDPETGLHDLQASERINRDIYTRNPARADALLEATRSILMRADLLGYMGQSQFSQSLLRDAAGLLQTLETHESTRPEARRLRARAAIHAADEMARLGLMDEAQEQLERARTDLEFLALDNSFDLHRRVEMARVSTIEAFIELHRGSLLSARERNTAAIEEIEHVIEFSLRNAEWQRHLVEAYIVQAYIAIGITGDLESGIEWASRAVVISRGTAFQDPSNLLSQTWLAVTHGIVGTLMQEYGLSAMALHELDTATGILEGLDERSPTIVFWRERRAQYKIIRARAMIDLESFEEAAQLARLVEVEWTGVARPDARLLLANAQLVRGMSLLGLEKEQDARASLEQALKAATELVEDQAPNRYRAMRTQAAALILLGRQRDAEPIVRTLEGRGFVGRDLGKLMEKAGTEY